MEGSGEYPTMDMEVTTNATRFTAEQGLLAALQRSKTNKKQNKKKVSMLDNIAQRMQNTQSLNFGGTFGDFGGADDTNSFTNSDAGGGGIRR